MITVIIKRILMIIPPTRVIIPELLSLLLSLSVTNEMLEVLEFIKVLVMKVVKVI